MAEHRKLKDSVVTITGGTGSFGSEMARHALDHGAAQVRIFSRDEAKQDAMRNAMRDARLRFFLGDTRDMPSVERAVRGSDLVFHAAALKQVPSAEFFPLEAVKTNINGSSNVLLSSIENEVKAVVCLSTDKAVYPINAMGMTKAVMEKTAMAYARDFSDSPTSISVTRYGNVMYSRGSVIPLFISQIKAGKSVTLTDPTMTRFLMSLRESVDLVQYAFEHATTGELFVRKAPAATIATLAQALFELFDARNRDIEILGFRHGEKLFESLLSVEERAFAADKGQYFSVPLDTRDLNYEAFFEEGVVRSHAVEAYTSHNTERLTTEQVIDLLLSLPELRRELSS